MKKTVSKYTLLHTLGCFFSLMLKSFNAWHVTLLYAAVLTLFSSAFALARYCGSVDCVVAVNLALAVPMLVIVFFYLYDFYHVAFKNDVFKLNTIANFSKNKIKSVGVLFCYFLCFAISAYISWKIFTKPANPDWRLEFVYFTVFFIFCMAPLLAMRFSAAVAFYFSDYKFPSLKYLYKKTEGRSYIGIIGFLTTMLILSMLNLYLQGAAVRIFTLLPLSLTANVLGSFINIVIILITFNLFFCFFEAQRQTMVEDDILNSKTAEQACTEEKELLVTENTQKKVNKKSDIQKKKKNKKK